MTLALATVLAWNCGGLRASDGQQSTGNSDATLNKLATELAAAEQNAHAVPGHVDAAPAPHAQSEPVVPSAADASAHANEAGSSVPCAPMPSDSTSTAK